MHYQQLYVTPATLEMIRDTVMCHRQLEAALYAIVALDWRHLREQVLSLQTAEGHNAEWNNVFLDHEGAVPGRHADWFLSHFTDYPYFFQSNAIRTARFWFSRRYKRFAAMGEVSLRQILSELDRPEPLTILLRKDVTGMTDHLGVVRMRLYDKTTQGWQTRIGAYEVGGPRPRVQEGEDGAALISAEDTAQWKFRIAGTYVVFRNNDPLEIEPVLDVLPVRDATFASHYWDNIDAH